MKRIAFASILALSLLGFASTRLADARTGSQSASGDYKFMMDDEFTKYVEFDARADERGTATGWMTFTDEAKLEDQDVDGAGDPPSEGSSPFFIKVEFDTMTVDKNRALMSGAVVDSSHRLYVGKWVQLVVEDNGDGREVPDQLVWRMCQPEPGGWIPTDAEWKDDDGAFRRWWATDAELKDDVGIPSPNLIPGTMQGCRVYSLSAYSFAEVIRGDGNIRVLP